MEISHELVIKTIAGYLNREPIVNQTLILDTIDYRKKYTKEKVIPELIRTGYITMEKMGQSKSFDLTDKGWIYYLENKLHIKLATFEEADHNFYDESDGCLIFDKES